MPWKDPAGHQCPCLSVPDYDLSEQAVRFIIGPGREDQLAGQGRVPITEPQAPQAIDHDRPAVSPPQLTQVCACCWAVDVDVAVAEVAHQQISTELAEPGRRQ